MFLAHLENKPSSHTWGRKQFWSWGCSQSWPDLAGVQSRSPVKIGLEGSVWAQCRPGGTQVTSDFLTAMYTCYFLLWTWGICCSPLCSRFLQCLEDFCGCSQAPPSPHSFCCSCSPSWCPFPAPLYAPCASDAFAFSFFFPLTTQYNCICVQLYSTLLTAE